MKAFKTMATVAAMVTVMGLVMGALPVEARKSRAPRVTVIGDNVVKSPLQKAQHAPKGAKKNPETKVNINTATLVQLQTLPRIGAKVAQRILDYRQAHNGFKSIDELRNVKGVGPKVLESLKPYLAL